MVDVSCFKEQRYKLFESNSQLMQCVACWVTSCFKEQRYKLFESNSQQNPILTTFDDLLFQRAKIQVI